jgi:hypothetical protein
MAGTMRQLARPDSDRIAVPRPRPAVGREDARGTRVPAPAVGNDTAAGLTGREGRSELLALQRSAGNHAVARLMGRGVVQRHPGPTANAEVEDGSANEGPGEEPAAPASAETAEGSASEGPVEGAAPASAEATSQPGTGTTGTTVTGLNGAARRKAIEDTLRASATGMWAQAIVDKWKIPVDYDFGGQGSFHQGGKIYVNKSLGVGAAALVLMHEAQHADTYKSGKQADREKLGRPEYITKSIADEAEATVRQIEGLAVTEGLGADMTGNAVGEGLKQRYLKAFYAKRDELKKANPDMDTAQINAICRTATRDGEVTKWFYDGTFVTSTNNNSYAVFYGNQWDEVHKTPGK